MGGLARVAMCPFMSPFFVAFKDPCLSMFFLCVFDTERFEDAFEI